MLLSNAVEIVFSSTVDPVGWVYISDGNEGLELFSFSPGVIPWEVEIGRDLEDAIKTNKIVKSDDQFHGKLNNRGGEANIHIIVSTFFWNRLFFCSVNTSIWTASLSTTTKYEDVLTFFTSLGDCDCRATSLRCLRWGRRFIKSSLSSFYPVSSSLPPI